MNKKQAISYIRSCVDANRKVTVDHVFTAENLPDVLRLHGIDDHIDVPLKDYKKKLLAIKNEDDVLTIGRLPLCDIQADHYEDNLISRVHVIFQKVGNEYRLINCGIYGTEAFASTPDGLQLIEPAPVEWEDFFEA